MFKIDGLQLINCPNYVGFNMYFHDFLLVVLYTSGNLSYMHERGVNMLIYTFAKF